MNLLLCVRDAEVRLPVKIPGESYNGSLMNLVSRTLLVNLLFCPPDLPAQPSPEAARTTSIEATKKAIQAECNKAANGDWMLWYEMLTPFRTAIRPRVDAAVDNPRHSENNPSYTYGIMRWLTDPNQYVHANTAITLGFVGDKGPLVWAKKTPMINIAVMMKSWLAARGIELILVPVPVKAEIYPDKLIADQKLVPEDLNVIPHMRRRYLEFLNAGVELIDLYPLLMKERRESNEPMYMVADTHWMQKPQRIAAEQIAARLERYPWVRTAQGAPARYSEVIERDRPTNAMFWEWLTPAERKAIEPLRLENIHKVVGAHGGREAVVEAADSPVLLAGDSFTSYDYPLQAGIVGLLAKKLNQPITLKRVAGALDGIFKEMFRDPSMLKGKKVVVWMLNDEPVGRGDMWPKNFALPRS